MIAMERLLDRKHSCFLLVILQESSKHRNNSLTSGIKTSICNGEQYGYCVQNRPLLGKNREMTELIIHYIDHMRCIILLSSWKNFMRSIYYNIHFLCMRKWEKREPQQFDQGHVTSLWWNQASNAFLCVLFH